jgi:glutathione synthase/RimK-type ligase-like ATP-grasp enzyme
MIVIVTNAADVHSDAVEVWLKEWKLPYFRFHPDELLSRYEVRYNLGHSSHTFEVYDTFSGTQCLPEKVKSVWFRRPLPPLSHKLSSVDSKDFFIDEISAFIASFYVAMENAHWTNPLPLRTMVNDKLMQLKIANSLGFRIPNTIVTTKPIEAFNFYMEENQNCIVKPFRQTMIEGNLKIFTHKLEQELTIGDFNSVIAAPTLLQQFIKKTSDLRVTLIGEEIFACRIYSQTNEKTKIDFRVTDVLEIPHEIVELNSNFKQQIIAFAKKFQLPSCEFDFAEIEGEEPFFLECNPNGQWLWIEIMCKVEISKSMARHLASKAGHILA